MSSKAPKIQKQFIGEEPLPLDTKESFLPFHENENIIEHIGTITKRVAHQMQVNKRLE